MDSPMLTEKLNLSSGLLLTLNVLEFLNLVLIETKTRDPAYVFNISKNGPVLNERC